MDLTKKLEGEKFNIIQISMTLATLAYDSTTELKSELSNTSLATEDDWSLVWGPVDKESNRVYVVKKKASDEYVIAIRGTIRSIESILIDIDFLVLASLPWNTRSDKMISDGMSNAWSHVNDMIDPKTGRSLSEFIRTLSSGSTVYVTGHSQGACLASVVSLWLAQNFNHISLTPITFAAETAGNKTFSDLFNNTFGSNNLRVFNPNDIVPMGFGGLDKIKGLYGAEPPYVECPDEIKLTIDLLEAAIPTYVQTGRAHPLPNSFVVKVNGEVHFYNRLKVFFEEIEVQHTCFTYLYLLNTPQTNGVPKTWPPNYINA